MTDRVIWQVRHKLEEARGWLPERPYRELLEAVEALISEVPGAMGAAAADREPSYQEALHRPAGGQVERRREERRKA